VSPAGPAGVLIRHQSTLCARRSQLKTIGLAAKDDGWADFVNGPVPAPPSPRSFVLVLVLVIGPELLRRTSP